MRVTTRSFIKTYVSCTENVRDPGSFFELELEEYTSSAKIEIFFFEFQTPCKNYDFLRSRSKNDEFLPFVIADCTKILRTN
jgi:hypothetical protein